MQRSLIGKAVLIMQLCLSLMKGCFPDYRRRPAFKGTLLREAYQQKVFIAGPSTLLVLLGMIERSWDVYQIEERAETSLVYRVNLVINLRLAYSGLQTWGQSIVVGEINMMKWLSHWIMVQRQALIVSWRN